MLGEPAGQVEVGYLEERGEKDKGPFIEQERVLLNAVAERLGSITERMLAEEQLQFQSQLLEAVGQSVIVTDLSGHVVYWNPSAERLYGWSSEEALGRLTTELMVDDYDQRPTHDIRAHFLTGKSWSGEYPVRHRDGTLLSIETTITPVLNTDGELTHIIGVASDIAERKQAEEALRVSEKAYRDLVEKISDVIYAVDAGGVITYLNPAIESLIGLPPEQVVGQPFAQFIHPEDLERLQGNIQNLFSGVAPGPAEYRVLNVKGETRWIRVTSQPVVEGDRVTGVQGVLTDITERKRVEAQLEEAAVLEERTRLARDLHDSVTQTLYSTNLFADAAHLAMSTGRTDTATKHLDAVRELIWQAMLEMRLLLFELRPPLLEEIGLVGALESRLESVETRVGLPIEFRVDGDRQLPPTVESELYLVALEALNNIAKHAQANRVTVHLRLDEERCRLVIQDDGSGFDPEAAGRGGGQGLRSMQERVAQLGGRLDLETAPGQGTTVTIEVKA
jgi:PAS domain S-box-containing protein